MSGRILGIDYGCRRIGLAVSDPLGITAQGLETYQAKSLSQAVSHVASLVSDLNAVKIVVGMPRNMDGSFGDQAEEVESFVEKLGSRIDAEIVLWDERWTTLAAARTLRETGTKIRGKKGKVDQLAAMFLLQSYLDSQSSK